MAIKEDKVREDRIRNEIVVDAYDESERAMGWFSYLEDTMKFPFRAICIQEKSASPLKMGEEVEVSELASGDDCEHEIFVTVAWGKRKLAVPLAQLKPVKSDAKTKQAIEDWHYWLQRGYEF